MVTDYLRLAPPEVTLAARDGASVVLHAASSPVYWTNPAMYLWTGAEHHGARAGSLADVARLCDALENVRGYSAWRCAMFPTLALLSMPGG